MFIKYAITVIDTVSTRDGSRSHTADKAYFEKLSSYNGYLHASSTVTTTFDSQEAAENFIEELPVSRCGEYNNKYEYGVEAIEYTHANHSGWSDVHPYEIVRVVSPKTIEIRVMDAELDKNWKPEIIAGGFAGHCTNQGAQKWDYKSALAFAKMATFIQPMVATFCQKLLTNFTIIIFKKRGFGPL
jgi:hypothetical protein